MFVEAHPGRASDFANAGAAVAGTLASMKTGTSWEMRTDDGSGRVGRRRRTVGGALGRATVAAALTWVVMVVAGAAGCTSTSSTPPVPSPSQSAPSGSATSTGPGMTAVPEAATCTQQRDLRQGARGTKPVDGVFLNGTVRDVSVNEEFVRGPDGDDADRCGNVLPLGTEAWCGQPAPWASMDIKDLVIAAGADRVRRIEVTSESGGDTAGKTPSGTATIGAERYPAVQWASYVEFELSAGDERGFGTFVRDAFTQCADAKPATLGGVPAVVGTTIGRDPSGDSPIVAFLTPTRVAWLVLDGRPWTAAERAHAYKVIAAHLR